MEYDFSELTPEQAAANIRSVLDVFQGTRQQHALLDASLAMLESPPPPPAVEEPPPA